MLFKTEKAVGLLGRRRVVEHISCGCRTTIAVGIGTALVDDPELTCRTRSGIHSPVRVVIDSRLQRLEQTCTDGPRNPNGWSFLKVQRSVLASKEAW